MESERGGGADKKTINKFLDHIYKAQEIIKLSPRRKRPLHFVLKSTTKHTYQDDLYIK